MLSIIILNTLETKDDCTFWSRAIAVVWSSGDLLSVCDDAQFKGTLSAGNAWAAKGCISSGFVTCTRVEIMLLQNCFQGDSTFF